MAREGQAVKAAEEFVRLLLDSVREAARAESASPARDRLPERRLLTTAEAADVLGIGRTTVNALIQNGALESVKIGRSRRVPLVCLDAFVDRLRSGDSLAGCEAIVRPMGS